MAMGGGGFSEEPDNPLLDDYVLSLANSALPKVCFVPTASGDAASYIVKFYSAFTKRECRPSHLAILQDMPQDLESFVLGQDIIYVGGGNTVTMLAAWRELGLDVVLRNAWRNGVILCGLSAGSICWFQSAPTDSYGNGRLRPLLNGLALLPGSHCPHYDTELARRPTYQGFVKDGILPSGYAADDGAALRFRDEELVEAVSSRPGAKAWRLERDSGNVLETMIPTRYLGSDAYSSTVT